ncbi:MAG: hypothetical protein ACD_49C00085G0001 [uncultured bacterium (gcode 4)]|uniref:Transmembrane protein n=1 Tax=uncultured bacterium (gcode 4) TaxID=1234023 RepID=K2AVU8_9BACT|nr:MAG: hypothetical protein ACD_49C00085G0001 [uncultured bacterium (gcode 4)]
MNYSINSKNRKLKYKLHLILNRLWFNFFNLSLSQKISFVGIIISFISLFLNWFTIKYDTILNYTAFSINAWYIGFIILLELIILLFLILSNSNKEKFKSKTNLVFHDHTIIIFFWLIIFLLTWAIFNSIKWFTLLFQDISIWNWIVFELVGSIFIIFSGILNYREKKQEILHKIYVENNLKNNIDLEEYRDILDNKPSSDKSNMSLPI